MINAKEYKIECESKGLVYSEERAQRVVDFISNLTHTKGKWAGRRFHLFDWQEELIRKLFGTLKPNGKRTYTKCYVEIPKKNGKSELAAAIALYLLFADDEIGAEVYSAAADREQAAIVFNVAAQMVRNNETLNGICKILDSVKRIVFHHTGSFYHVLSADVNTKHGFNIHGCIFDELHAQPKRDLWDVLTEGAGDAREQPLTFAITTAGYDRNSICWEVHEYAKKVKEGTIEDNNFLPIIYSLDEKEDWEKEENWYRVNPSLDKTVDVEKVRIAHKEAREIPAKQNTFRRLRLNQWTQQENRYVDIGKWNEQAGKVNEFDLRGRSCCGGLDLSSVSDITAWVMVFPYSDDPEEVDILCRFWCPESRLYDKRNKYADQYQAWEKQGHMMATPGDAVDYQFVKKQVMDDCDKFNVLGLNIDRLFQGYQIAMEIENEILATRSSNAEVAGFAMGHKSFSIPMKEFERRFKEGKLHHGGNPVLRWMIDNVAVKPDVNDNLMPDKAQSQGKIDGFVALVLALDMALRHKDTVSIYETEDIAFI